MNLTLSDIFNYIIKKYKFYISLILFGIALSVIYIQNISGKSKIIYSINTEYLFWEQKVILKNTEKFQNLLRVNSRYEGIVESVKLDISHEYISDASKAKVLFDSIECSKTANFRILTCKSENLTRQVDEFILINSQIIGKIFTDEIQKAIETIETDPYYTENPIIIESQKIKLKNFYDNNNHKIFTFAHQEIKPKYIYLIFITFMPFFIVIGFLIIINPEIFLSLKNKRK